MCYKCYEEAGCPAIINEKTKTAADLIKKLYQHPDCMAGGYAHIVTDDWNLEDYNIQSSISAAEKGEYDWINEEGRQLCLQTLHSLKPLTENERYSALALVHGFIS